MTWCADRKPNDDLHRVADGLDGAVQRLTGVPTSVLDQVFSRWEELVGPQIAPHAQPLSLRQGTLVIGVAEPAWATQLRFLSGVLLGRLEELGQGGAVTSIEVRVRR
jgi:predicted nucleic acid-binding Zn ribbon protein